MASARAADASTAATKTVSSPAIVPTASGRPASSSARATGCAPAGGVFRTTSVPAARTERTDSARTRSSRSSRRSESTAGSTSPGDGVAPRCLDEPKIADVAGESRLGRCESPVREEPLQLLLRPDGLLPHEADDGVAPAEDGGAADKYSLHEIIFIHSPACQATCRRRDAVLSARRSAGVSPFPSKAKRLPPKARRRETSSQRRLAYLMPLNH